MGVVRLEQDVVHADRIHQLARRVLLEDVTTVDLAREVLARLELELRVVPAHLSVFEGVVAGFEDEGDEADPRLHGQELELRKAGKDAREEQIDDMPCIVEKEPGREHPVRTARAVVLHALRRPEGLTGEVARSDVEAIALAWDLLDSLGIQGLALELNTLGSSEDRARYRDQLVAYLQQHRDRLDPDSQDRLERNPLRILDSKNAETQALLVNAPTLAEALAPESRDRFEQVKAGLEALAIEYTLNPRLVRGLDYYSHTAFEITSTQLGAQATVCGGGRYDGLVEQLGGPATPAIGWALGMERLVMLLGQEDASPAPDLYLVSRGEAAESAALVLARSLRLAGLRVERDPSGAAFGKQFKRADRSGAPWAAVIGDGEVDREVVRLKPLREEGEEHELSLKELAAIQQLLETP